MSDEKTVSISEQLEDIKADICDHICRYSALEEIGEYEVDYLVEKYCRDCPLNRL